MPRQTIGSLLHAGHFCFARTQGRIPSGRSQLPPEGFDVTLAAGLGNIRASLNA